MRSNTLWVGLVAYLAGVAPSQADKTSTILSTQSTTSLFLPPRDTGGASIYASVITQSASTTQYLLACQTSWAAPANCKGDFKGVTATYAPSSFGAVIAGTTYKCSLGKDNAVCASKTKSDASDKTSTVASSETSKWFTPVTLVQSTTQICKRKKSKGKGGGGGDDDCSSGAGIKGQNVAVGTMALLLGTYIAIALAL
ncbi:unnamed protein product [Clonostachys rhizophaga]|uniref:Uncharacterized protein n=1 Tax=Clonostachys rhizophaga TaxID=160324 RepID=A0A9N9VEX2_9HYPO|nr:unnamed protein product [Clonostachys rhizophaga]